MDDGQPNIYLVNWKEASKVLTETHQQFLGIKHFPLSGSPASNLLWHVAAGLGAEGAGDSDDHQDGGEAQDQVWTVLARTRGWVAISWNKILIKFLFFRNKLVMWTVQCRNREHWELWRFHCDRPESYSYRDWRRKVSFIVSVRNLI